MDIRTEPPVIVEPAAPGRRPLLTTIAVLLAIAGVAALAWFLVMRAKAPEGGPGGGRGGGGAEARGGRGGAGGAGGANGGGRRPPSVVSVARVVTGEAPVVRAALGTVMPIATAQVRPQVSGPLIEVAFEEGQRVRKGQLLARIDPRPFQLVVDQARAGLQRDAALLANARVDLGRYQTLLRQDSIAGQQVQTQEAAVRQNQATLAADKATLGTAELNLSFTRLVAPVTGRVGLRQADVGNYVLAGQTTVAVVTQERPIDVQFTLPEDQVPQVSARLRGGGSLPVTILDRGRTRRLAEGRLFTLDNQVDTTTGTLRAKARFDNADGALIPNQFVNVDLTVLTMPGVALAPSAAVRKGSRGDYVYVVAPDRTARVRVVRLGPVVGEQVAVLDGLREGEMVVTEGSDRLTDGARVMLPGDKRPGGGGPGGGRGGGRRRGG